MPSLRVKFCEWRTLQIHMFFFLLRGITDALEIEI